MLALGLAAAVTAGGCGPGGDRADGGGGDEDGGADQAAGGPITWKAGATVLFAPVDTAPEPRWLDAVADGDRAFVLFASRAGNRLALSDDGGASFRFVDVQRAREAGVEEAPSVTDDLMVLHPYGARLVAFVRGSGAASSVPFWQVMDLDTTTGRLSGTARLPFGRLFLHGKLATSFSSAAGSTAPQVTFGRIDLDTGVVDSRAAPYALGPTVCLSDDWHSLDGDHFVTACETAMPEPGWCLLDADSTSGTTSIVPTGRCLPRGFWPGGGASTVTRARAAGGLDQIFYRAGHTFAASLAPGTPPAASAVHLARQQVTAVAAPWVERERLGGLLPLLGGTGPLDARLVTWDGTRDGAGAPLVSEVPLAKTACAGDARCFTAPQPSALPVGYGTLAAALPLGGDRWLALHLVRDELSRPNRATASGPWDYLVALPGTAAPTAISEPPPDEPPTPLPGFAGAVAASGPLEAVCARLVSCFPDATFPTGGKLDIRGCATSWLAVGAGDPAADAAYQRFLATPAGDCAAFHDTWPQVLLPRTYACGCQGDVAVVCPSGAPIGAFDCRARGLGCVLDALGRATCAAPFTTPPACNACDAAGRATTCLDALPPPPPRPAYVMQADCAALGLTCRAPTTAGGMPFCGPTQPPCRQTMAFMCDGAVASACTGSPAVVTDRRDCARTGQLCAGGAGCVSSATSAGVASTCPLPGEQCQGQYLVYCLGGASSARQLGPARWLDCAALGYRTCAMLGDRADNPHARCVP